MVKLKKAVIAVMLTIATMAHAEFIDGNLLLSRMLGDDLDQVFALAYTVGAADSSNGVYWCPKGDMKSIEVFNLTKALLIATPTKRNTSADVFVVTALRKVYPCAPKVPAGSKAV